jgi:hypothetical protein
LVFFILDFGFCLGVMGWRSEGKVVEFGSKTMIEWFELRTDFELALIG